MTVRKDGLPSKRCRRVPVAEIYSAIYKNFRVPYLDEFED